MRTEKLSELSKPVAWLAIYHGDVYDEAISITRSVVEAQANRLGWESALTEIIPLYTAPPAPAAQDAVDIFADQIIGTKKQVIRIPSPIKNNKYGGSSYFYADDIIKTLELQGLIVLIDF
ncbi:hypothetical protein K7R09_25725 [Serratia ureilytica]|uniref:Uncharacterized protein n=1 Tax=Serratia ureilytica TaxID=300181 RepID=A0ABU0VME9_9GAMM|nr:hypothetical protein [Serratia ureilytica]MCU7065199.1 hypothetical protein [Serratia ureilytica]MDQ1809579.1 hypothetical protein [Serratia ureilytica]MDQ1838036.1 hypothetical protein [Serratia ureilytica]MDQ1862604.1 hypothetical protein [Serratia ureilytica]